MVPCPVLKNREGGHGMTEKVLAVVLADILNQYRRHDGEMLKIIEDVCTFRGENEGLGIVLKTLDNGLMHEYYITVHKKK